MNQRRGDVPIERIIDNALDSVLETYGSEAIPAREVLDSVLQTVLLRLMARGISEKEILDIMRQFARDTRLGLKSVLSTSESLSAPVEITEDAEIMPDLEANYFDALLGLLLWGIDVSSAPSFAQVRRGVSVEKLALVETIPNPTLLVTPPNYSQLVNNLARGPVDDEAFIRLAERCSHQLIKATSSSNRESALIASHIRLSRKKWTSFTVSETRQVSYMTGFSHRTVVSPLPEDKNGSAWTVKIVNGTSEFEERRDTFQTGKRYELASEQLADLLKDESKAMSFMSDPRDYLAFVISCSIRGVIPDQDRGTLLRTSFPSAIAKTGKRGVSFYPVGEESRSKNLGGLRQIVSLL